MQAKQNNFCVLKCETCLAYVVKLWTASNIGVENFAG